MNKCCATCPFLEVNRDRKTPIDFKCVEQNETDWYSQENINGIWTVLAKQPQPFLSCHTTDPDYYGKDEKDVWACVGGAFLVYMHVKIYDHLQCDYKKYRQAVGSKVAMTRSVLAEKTFAFLVGRTSIFMGGMKVASRFIMKMESLRYPNHFDRTVKKFKAIQYEEKKKIHDKRL